jgi:NADPH-dependent 2,4-dienoyl-CoA reductase/sulfur reductase-like enzyme
MTAVFRAATGGHIDRAHALRFSFDGQRYSGLAGDTLASALLANGVHLMGRSFKYHRPRGVLAAGAEEPNALVTVRRDAARCTPNLRATQVELYDGLQAHSQNRWPSLAFDVGAINNLLSPLFPAGFYYKTFMWPPPPPPPSHASSCVTSRRGSAARCWRIRTLMRTHRPRAGWRKASRRCAPMRASRCCRARPPLATSRTTSSASTSA